MTDLRDGIPRSDRQLAAELEARTVCERRLQTGMCSKDLFVGFNSRRACALPAGHDGRCA